MARQRKFKKHTVRQQYIILLRSLTYALSEGGFPSRKTDAIGIACQYGNSYGVKREDFDMIKDLSFNELIDILEMYKEEEEKQK